VAQLLLHHPMALARQGKGIAGTAAHLCVVSRGQRITKFRGLLRLNLNLGPRGYRAREVWASTSALIRYILLILKLSNDLPSLSRTGETVNEMSIRRHP